MLKTIPIQKNSGFERKKIVDKSGGRDYNKGEFERNKLNSGREDPLSGFDSDKEIKMKG